MNTTAFTNPIRRSDVGSTTRRVGLKTPVDRERTFGTEQVIISKTDVSGVITYVNEVFTSVSGYSRDQLQGQTHEVVWHPDFPVGIFEIIWNSITSGHEVWAYVKNLASDGSYYWNLSHVTPSIDATGATVGYHCSRRVPEPAALQEIAPLYAEMLEVEKAHKRRGDAGRASAQHLIDRLAERGFTYDAYIWDVINRTVKAA